MKLTLLLLAAFATLIVAKPSKKLGWEPTGDSIVDFKRIFMDIEYRYLTDHNFKAMIDKQARDWPPYVNDTIDIEPFNCEVDSEDDSEPQTVHELRPRDIDIIGAIGDSITAGFGIGASNMAQVSRQNRGESWSVGGDYSLEKNVITVPTILRKFNPEVKGFSSCIGGWTDETRARMNLAVGGATSNNMENQANNLLNRMRDYIGIDFENDWKVLTLFIGGNDLCRACDNPLSNPASFTDSVERAIDVWHEHMPRALVNLVPMFDVSPLTNMSTGEACDDFHQTACRCAMNEEDRKIIRGYQREYYERLSAIVQSAKWETRSDFTVVMQPFLVDMEPWTDENGEWDTSIFSPDCFHFNRKGHQMIALGLWNTMVMPVRYKPYFFDITNEDNRRVFCPSEENPYFFTQENSQCIWWEEEIINCDAEKAAEMRREKAQEIRKKKVQEIRNRYKYLTAKKP